MRLMGDKLESKRVAKEAKVNCIPGFNGTLKDENHALKIANEIGYPVMLKASAGGGGKGMRVLWNDDDLIGGYKLAKAEAFASFGDDRLLIEKFIESPRHIEFQILGDKYGNVIYLPERECSIQRRNQKIIEESPSPFISQSLREKIGQQAVALAKAVGYESAGTVEFLVDAQQNFYFLEMNTRLQVEHPITEYVTGLDIVEEMINIARGGRLSLTQDQVKVRGWSFESRIYAEDPKTFLPYVGRLERYIEPIIPADKSVRCDSGVTEGSEVSMFYDPLLCKVCTHGKTRHEAMVKMTDALDQFVIQGITHNIPLLCDIFNNENFQKGKIDTNFLKNAYGDGFDGHKLDATEEAQLHAIAAAMYNKIMLFNRGSIHLNGGNESKGVKVYIAANENGYKEVIIKDRADFSTDYQYLNETVNLKLNWDYGDSKITVENPKMGKYQVIQYQKSTNGFILTYKGSKYSIQYRNELEQRLSTFLKQNALKGMAEHIKSPMPGTVISLNVKEDMQVSQGDELCVIEAMKMQNVIKSPRSGILKSINIKVGQQVPCGHTLFSFV